MRKLIPIFLLCLLLCACTQQAVEETTLPTESTQPTDHVEPTGTYDPDSALERATGGALRCYLPQKELIYHMEALGDGVLLFSGVEGTTLTSLAGEGLYVQGELTLPFWLRAGVSTQVSSKGVTYVDPMDNALVFLDPSLKEARRIALPEELVGDPVLPQDRATLYYCTADAIRALDLDTGIKRLVKQLQYPTMTLEAILLEGSVLQCGVADGQGKWEHLFLDAQTGQTLSRTGVNLTVHSGRQGWYAAVEEGSVFSLVFGQGSGAQSQLNPADITAAGFFQPGHHTAVTATADTLSCYDLATGRCTARLSLEVSIDPWCVTAGENAACIWFLTGAGEEPAAVCRWELSKSPAEDEAVYTSVRYSAENPDALGLETCREEAQALEKKYGIRILIAGEAAALDAPDYTLGMEYSVPVIRLTLQKLDKVLSWYPQDFLKKAVETTSDKTLTVGILRSLTGTPQAGNLGAAPGLQYWQDTRAFLLITAGDDFELNFCRELCHAMETRVFADSGRYDDWDKLNPEGFAYDYDYLANAARDGSEYLRDEDRAFVDTYSMSFPKEDRATVMAYAMQPGNEGLFRSEIMQSKLTALCQGIREAFGWKKSAETFLWEQYLKEPLAYQENK